MEEERIDPSHQSKRELLRILGPTLIVVGILCILIGGYTMFSPAWSEKHSVFGSDFEDSARTGFTGFGIVFVGMILLGVGSGLTKFGFAGAVARYAAGEVAPVAKDTLNYMANGTREGVKAVSTAVAAGIAEGVRSAGGVQSGGKSETLVRCLKCNAANPEAAKFCNQCGATLGKTKPCPSCGELNDGDARFCDSCGRPVT